MAAVACWQPGRASREGSNRLQRSVDVKEQVADLWRMRRVVKGAVTDQGLHPMPWGRGVRGLLPACIEHVKNQQDQAPIKG